jgi:hypothetical protein
MTPRIYKMWSQWVATEEMQRPINRQFSTLNWSCLTVRHRCSVCTLTKLHTHPYTTILSHVWVIQMGFRLVIGFTEHLQIVITSNYSANGIHTLCSALRHMLRLLSLLCLHQSLPGDGSQQCSVLPCSRPYRLVTVPQLIAPTVLLIISRHRQQRKRCFSVAVSIVAFASDGMPSWSLLSHCLTMAIVYKAIT